MPAVPDSARRIKIAVVIGTLEVGGAELDIARNFPRLNRDEFEVVVVCFTEAGALAPQLEHDGVRVVARRPGRPAAAAADAARSGTVTSTATGVSAGEAAPGHARVGRGRLPRALRPAASALYVGVITLWVARVLAKEKADVVHAFLPHSYAYAMFARAISRPRAKTVMSRLSLNFYKDTHRRLAWLERTFLHRWVDIAIGNSQLILDELAEEGVDPGKLRLLHNGIDPSLFACDVAARARARQALGLSADAFVAVAVGNLHEYKGHRDLIEACALASGSLPPEWLVLVAGSDPHGNRAGYEELAAQRGIAENVRFLGRCDDVAQLLMAADVFVHPSHHEGLPNAIVEAMASSLPVVATTVGGIPEAVLARTTGANLTEETGWLVAPHGPSALAEVLVEAAKDPARRERMGARARERVLAEFSLDKSVSAYEAIYRSLVQ